MGAVTLNYLDICYSNRILNMNSKISKSGVIFIFIVAMLALDVWQKNENYNQFLLLKNTYLNSKKNNKTPIKQRARNLDWSYLLQIWNQKAQESNCQIKQIQTKNPGLELTEYQIKVSGQFFDLLKWLKATHEFIPQLFWTKIVMTIKANHQLELIVEGGLHV